MNYADRIKTNILETVETVKLLSRFLLTHDLSRGLINKNAFPNRFNGLLIVTSQLE